MEIFLGIVFLLAGIFNTATAIITDYNENENLKNGIIYWASIILAGVCFGIALDYFVSYNTQKEHQPKEYPSKEYRLSIKISTVDEQKDTTYIITKK